MKVTISDVLFSSRTFLKVHILLRCYAMTSLFHRETARHRSAERKLWLVQVNVALLDFGPLFCCVCIVCSHCCWKDEQIFRTLFQLRRRYRVIFIQKGYCLRNKVKMLIYFELLIILVLYIACNSWLLSLSTLEKVDTFDWWFKFCFGLRLYNLIKLMV